MPVYEYCCNSCNFQFELRQKFSDQPADRCPECGGSVRKIVSATSFSLKGAGWFGDGYGKKNETSSQNGNNVAGAGTAKEIVSTDATPAVTAAAPATEESAPARVEKKTVATGAAQVTKVKTEAKSLA